MRNYRMDNIKCFLVFCVVAGHMLELVDTGGWYRIIYSFHMPSFIFVSGSFAKFSKERIVNSLIYPYMVFQFLYLVFDAAVINHDLEALKIQYSTPFWLLWYLMVLIFYYLLIPFMEGTNPFFMLVVGVVLSLVAGFDQSIGYYMSLARFFTFLPYFILGKIWKHLKAETLLQNHIFRCLNVLFVLLSCFFLGRYQYISNSVLYGSHSYVSANYSILVKGMLLLCGVNWIFFFMWVFPKIRIPVISSIGKNTLTIFLLHGFVKRYLGSIDSIFIYSRNVNMALAILISIIVVLVFGNRYVGLLGKLIFTGEGISKVMGYMKVRVAERLM